MSFGFVQSKCLADILLLYFLFEFILSIFNLFISDKYTLPPELIILLAIAKPKPSAPAEITVSYTHLTLPTIYSV